MAERITIRVAADRMKAFVAVAAASRDAGGDAEGLVPLSPTEALRAALTNAGVVDGVDEDRLRAIALGLADPSFAVSETEIAAGRPPVDGTDGYVSLAFEQGLAPGRLDAEGHMNFFDRGLLKVVATGEVVARVVPPETGSAGVTVVGEVLPARAGARVSLQLGAGVTSDADGVVRASRSGVVLYKTNETLDVVVQHVHRGPVDLHSGHLDMSGSLTIKGDVERLLQARATGDLEVLGSVSAGSLSAGGSIRVSGSVRGGDASRVVAEHDVTIKSCEAADVSAGGVLRVQESVNSRLCGQHVVIVGRLRGGAAVAERSLVVKEAGSLAGVVTQLQAGQPLELPDLEGVQRAVMLQKLRRMAERGGVRDAFGSRGIGRAKGGKLGRANAAWSADELKERAQHAEQRAALERVAVVELGIAHPGVELRIGSARCNVEQLVRGVRYALDAETGQLRAERTVG